MTDAARLGSVAGGGAGDPVRTLRPFLLAGEVDGEGTGLSVVLNAPRFAPQALLEAGVPVLRGSRSLEPTQVRLGFPRLGLRYSS